MKFLIVTGSPRRNSVSNRLANAFQKGVEEAGHTVERYDVAAMQIGPCKGCSYCRKHGGVCLQKDDMTPFLGAEGKIMTADRIVFVTPLYYFGMSAQLKLFLDRIYALGRTMREQKQGAYLLCSAGDDNPQVGRGLLLQFEQLCQWTHWQQKGALLAVNCHDIPDLEKTDFETKAYQMGKIAD